MEIQTPGMRLSLDAQLCFVLYGASRAFTNLYRPFLDSLGLTYPQYLVMLVLWEHDEVTVKELGTTLRLTSGTLSPLLKRLEARELLTRRRTTEDERSVTVTLTETGRQLREGACPIPDQMLAATGMDLDQMLELRSRLERLIESLDVGPEAKPGADAAQTGL